MFYKTEIAEKKCNLRHCAFYVNRPFPSGCSHKSWDLSDEFVVFHFLNDLDLKCILKGFPL